MEEQNIQELSEQEVVDVIKMATEIYNYLGVYTPSLLNQNLNSLNNNPIVPTKEGLNDALLNYTNSSDELQGFMEFAEAYDSLFERTIEYYANMLAFDLDISCTNAYRGKADYESKEYKEDKRRVYKFFDCFKYKYEFKKVLKNVLRSEEFFTWLRDTKGTFSETGSIDLDEGNVKVHKTDGYVLQILPQNKCKTTATWEHGALFDFDMTYFLKAGVDINEYDPAFKKYWRNTFGDGNTKDPHYIPTADLKHRDGTFAMWTQTSPEDGAWVFKLDDSNFNARPMLSSLIKQVLSNEEMRKLQTDANMLSAKGLLVGEIPLLDDKKGSTTTDQMAYKITTLTKLLSLVKAGLTSNINAVAMPTTANDFYQFEGKDTKDILTDQYKIFAGQGASASRLIYSSDKMTKDELENAIITDYNMVSKIYGQFNSFLNFFVNKKTRKYKFEFVLSGSTYPFIRERMKKNLMELATNGIVLNSSAYAKIVDMTPQHFDRALEEGKYTGWTEELLSQLINVHTQSGKETDNTKDDSELTESGAVARDYE